VRQSAAHLDDIAYGGSTVVGMALSCYRPCRLWNDPDAWRASVGFDSLRNQALALKTFRAHCLGARACIAQASCRSSDPAA
jgi:hypothetical protein